jgi:hypothetical protein
VGAGGCDFDGAFHMLPTFDLAEVEFLFSGSGVGPAVGRTRRLQGDIAAQKMNDLRQRTGSVDRFLLPKS